MNHQTTASGHEEADEEAARSEVYGVLTLLYYAPPAIEWIAKLRRSATRSGAAAAVLQQPWSALVKIAGELSDAVIRAEYDVLFGGLGKPEVYLYGSHFLSGFLNEKPLVRLRTDLAAIGLKRDADVLETEDHFAYLCEVMRYLITQGGPSGACLARQRDFFRVHIHPWAQRMCDDIERQPRACFYRAVAVFTRAFLTVEAQGFDMLE